MAAVNDSRNLLASRDCFGVSQRRRVAVPYISGDVCLPISGVKHNNKTMQLCDRSLPCALLLVLVVLSGREVHGAFATSFRYASCFACAAAGAQVLECIYDFSFITRARRQRSRVA
ncbi:MAG: hypothetical protein ABIR00_04600 [Nitrosospira sp.]